jgi:hypothetical protein
VTVAAEVGLVAGPVCGLGFAGFADEEAGKEVDEKVRGICVEVPG